MRLISVNEDNAYLQFTIKVLEWFKNIPLIKTSEVLGDVKKLTVTQI